MARRESWNQVVGRVGGAALDLLSAEARSLRDEVALSSKTVARLAAVGGLVFGLLFWGMALFLASAVSALALLLPLWGAALAIALLLVVISLALALWIRARFRRLDSPAKLIRKRLDDHVEWWQSEVAGQHVGSDPRPASAYRTANRAHSSKAGPVSGDDEPPEDWPDEELFEEELFEEDESR
jgi:hypothetical protein